ncbi:MAG: hypothetical protein K6G52_00030 [Treponemataceae bacterium]|nr:hypothetical protein [Treponemataceae bacterium]
MTDEMLGALTDKIHELTSIVLANPQLAHLDAFCTGRMNFLKLDFEKYLARLEPNSEETKLLINQVTINETYFFREERQFEFLYDEFFPRFKGKEIKIWSAACSTGEEALSLLALAEFCGTKPTMYASDIDEETLKFFRQGRYAKFSFRPDGALFHPILYLHGQFEDSQFVIDREFLNKINIFQYNLSSDQRPPIMENVDLIFMRNVFIYFDQEGRIKITGKVANLLKEDGLLFYSTNEVLSISENVLKGQIKKEKTDMVYYFIKKSLNQNESEKTDEKQAAKTNSQKKTASCKGEKKDIKTLAEEIKKKHAHSDGKPGTTCTPGSAAGSGVAATLGTAATTSSATDASDVKCIFKQVCAQINILNYKKAMELAMTPCKYIDSPYFLFMQGYVEYYENNKDRSIQLFSQAELLKNDFWPAYFYHGLSLNDIGENEKSRVPFKKCMELLTPYEKNDGKDTPYDFVLDSFSPNYILSVCKKFIDSRSGGN